MADTWEVVPASDKTETHALLCNGRTYAKGAKRDLEYLVTKWQSVKKLTVIGITEGGAIVRGGHLEGCEESRFEMEFFDPEQLAEATAFYALLHEMDSRILLIDGVHSDYCEEGAASAFERKFKELAWSKEVEIKAAKKARDEEALQARIVAANEREKAEELRHLAALKAKYPNA